MSTKLRSWNELTEEVSGLPVEVGLALMSGRPELLAIAGKSGFTPEQAQAVIDLLRVLMDTNLELQRHAETVSTKAANILGHAKGLMRALEDVRAFAEFEEEAGEGGDD